jgi:hypothetical protein
MGSVKRHGTICDYRVYLRNHKVITGRQVAHKRDPGPFSAFASTDEEFVKIPKEKLDALL